MNEVNSEILTLFVEVRKEVRVKDLLSIAKKIRHKKFDTAKLLNESKVYADCLGYVAAKNLGLFFLIGDKEFKEMPNVVFAK